jgi:hypothetical protein
MASSKWLTTSSPLWRPSAIRRLTSSSEKNQI